MTFRETLDGEDGFTPDFTKEMASKAVQCGYITIYSSYDIKAGVFVTPSKMEAESYAGNGLLYEKTVPVDDMNG